MGHKKNTWPGRTLKEVLDDHYPGVIWCTSHTTCRQHFTLTAHHEGYVDGWGRLHYDRAYLGVRVDGLHRALALVAIAVNPQWRPLPWHMKAYYGITWANRELFTKYKREPHAYWNYKIRRRVAHRKKVPFKVRQWANYEQVKEARKA